MRVVVCDLLRQDGKWRNIAAARLHDLIRPEALFDWLAHNGGKVAAIVHMAAISTTTEPDVDRYVASNIRLTLDLWQWCAANQTRFIYASSAATYGDGSAGFADDESPSALAELRPLNAYGWSKHVVDRRVIDDVTRGLPTPPQWAGLKFFNVYGANEAHKGPMQSMVAKIVPVIRAGEAVTLFRSHNPQYADGGQLRDFVYVKDCVAVVSWLLREPIGQRPLQCRHRHGAQLSRPRGRGLRAARLRARHSLCRHACRIARAISIFHRGEHRASCAPPALPRRSTRSKAASATISTASADIRMPVVACGSRRHAP